MPQSVFTSSPQSVFAQRISHAQSLWRDIWYENECVCLFGDPGLGKSTLAFQIAEEIADKGYGVIYIDFDNIDHQYESKGLKQIGNCLVDTLYINPSEDFADAINYKKLLSSIEAEILENEASVIVIDDISYLCPMRDCERTRRVLQQFRFWLRKYFVSILVIAHARKHPEGLPLGINHLTGSRQLAYAFDAVFTLNEVTSPTFADTCTHYVKQLKARNSSLAAPSTQVLPLRFEYVDDPHMLFDEGEEVNEAMLPTCFKPFYRFKITDQKVSERDLTNIPSTANPRQVEQFIFFCDIRGWSVRQIAEHMHISKSTVHRILARRYDSLVTYSPSDISSVKKCPIVPTPSTEPSHLSAPSVATIPDEATQQEDSSHTDSNPLSDNEQNTEKCAALHASSMVSDSTLSEQSKLTEPSMEQVGNDDEDCKDDENDYDDKQWDPCANEASVSSDP